MIRTIRPILASSRKSMASMTQQLFHVEKAPDGLKNIWAIHVHEISGVLLEVADIELGAHPRDDVLYIQDFAFTIGYAFEQDKIFRSAKGRFGGSIQQSPAASDCFAFELA